MFKQYIQRRLEKYVKQYFDKHRPKLVVVVGSVGKTTTKTAIATVLASKFNVRMEPENHNTEISLPLAVLGIAYPPPEVLHKFGTWHKIYAAIRQRIRQPDNVQIIIQELGTERPGEIAGFGQYLRPDIAVVTAVAPEHMANFPDGLAAVAREELSVANFSQLLIVNHDDVDGQFASLVDNSNITDYGTKGGEYRFATDDQTPLDGYSGSLLGPEFGANGIPTTVHLVGEHNLKAIAAAASVAAKLGMSAPDIAAAVQTVRPVAGRMNLLKGVRGSTIIDDTYNSSPSAAIAALLTMYLIKAPHRIAILGSMNELGDFSAAAHQQVGQMCDPNWLDWVITIGEEANQHLAPAAKANGCQVATFVDPISAGAFANQVIEDGAAVLAKGSQNGVFAEEAVKIILDTTDQESQLVRQSADWIARKKSWIESIEKIPQDDD
jgi:UDP-N-acetylmuramoyl-tripeptide--D-alanyl-D-alanine ligase